MVCETDQEPCNPEPEKCAGWEWVPWEAPDVERLVGVHRYVFVNHICTSLSKVKDALCAHTDLPPGCKADHFPIPAFAALAVTRAARYSPFDTTPCNASAQIPSGS